MDEPDDGSERGLRCLIADHALSVAGAEDPAEIPRPREGWELREGWDRADLREPAGTETGRGLWLAA